MLMPWFIDLATFCSANKIDWGVITNGSSLSATRVAQLVAAKPLNIDISLDSVDAAEHDFLRGVSGSAEQVRDGVERLVAKRRQTGSEFAIRLKPTVTRQTIRSLGNLVSWAETMPSVVIDFSPVRLWRPDEIAEMYPSDPEEFAALEAQIESLLERKRAGAPIETSDAKLRAMLPRFSHRPVIHGVTNCRVGLRSIDIRPNGDVDHCFKFRRIGNLRHSTMKAIWQDAARRMTIEQTLGCDLLQTTCSTSCKSHRTALQDAARGLRALRSTRLR
jgi:radical SAM protein with 4Fe4S-binding SPASM domain